MSPSDLSPQSTLLASTSTAPYEDAVTAGAALVARAVERASQPFSGMRPEQLSPRVDAVDLDTPLADLQTALAELDDLYLRDAVYFHHPRYLAHLNCPVAVPALAAEAVLSAVNSSMDTWDQSVGATLIERRLVAWTAERIGYGAGADGIFTSGGTQSNLQALAVARDEAMARHTDIPREQVLGRLRILASEAAHFSVQRAASLLGLAPDSVVTVHTDDARRMCAKELSETVTAVRDAGELPFAVVATAGTTDFGSIDPLIAVADVAENASLWFHVDAAYGCGLLVSRRRALLGGIERADSVTVDFHKSYFQPVSSSALLVRDGHSLRHVTIRADYLNPADNARRRGVGDQVDKSLQTTRRFDALKLWLTLRTLGADGVGQMFDAVIDLAADIWRELSRDPRFEVVVRPELSTVVFRWVPGVDQAWAVGPHAVDAANLHARDALFGSGEAVIASTKVDGRTWLKFTLLNPQTALEDVLEVLELVAARAEHGLVLVDPNGVSAGRGAA